MSTAAPLHHREWLSAPELAEYLGISLSAAYRLAHDLGARRRKRVGLRVRRALVDQHVAPPPPAPPVGPAGTPPACPDRDDEEVLPGLTRRQLRAAAGRA